MGRGGGGGGGHHSSHHSSSHSHSGGSYRRSSGSSYRSSSSSYRSSGRSYSHHSGRSHYSSGGGGGCGGCSSILTVPIVLIIFVVYFFDEVFGFSAVFEIERSTVRREPLPASKCEMFEEWYRDDWGDWIDESGEAASLMYGMNHFYNKTGVQPYLWIMGEEGGEYKSEGSLEELADETYKDMFGNDEGHLLVIFREYPNASGNYICTITPGYDAETQVMDDQAKEIFLDCIDYYYSDEDLNEGEFFSEAFFNSADRIMTKQLSLAQLGTIIAIVIVLVAGLCVLVAILKKRKVALAKQKAQQAQAEANKAKTDFERKQYEDNLETQFVAVACPNCGASGNRIRKATVGYCQYCGTAIRVEQDGTVKIANGSGT